jgi:hypothetical protein
VLASDLGLSRSPYLDVRVRDRRRTGGAQVGELSWRSVHCELVRVLGDPHAAPSGRCCSGSEGRSRGIEQAPWEWTNEVTSSLQTQQNMTRRGRC